MLVFDPIQNTTLSEVENKRGPGCLRPQDFQLDQ